VVGQPHQAAQVLLVIGPVTITGREALGTDLAVELLARHDAA
jgi:hypothetical protein